MSDLDLWPTPASADADLDPVVFGQILLDGLPLAGVRVDVGAFFDTTDALGDWAVSVTNGDYTVTPSLVGYTFTPASGFAEVRDASFELDFDAVEVVVPPPPIVLPVAARRVVLVHVEVGAGTYYFSNSEFGDLARRWYQSRIVGRVQWSRAATTVLWGGSAASELGVIEIANADGALNELRFVAIEAGIEAGRVRVFECLSTEGIESAVLIASALLASIEPREDRLRIVSRDVSTIIDAPIHGKYPDTAIESLRGKPRPFALGSPLSCPPVLVDEVDFVFDCHDGAGFTLEKVREGGLEMTPTTDYVVASAPNFGVELLDAAQAQIVVDIGTTGTSTASNIALAIATRSGQDPSLFSLTSLIRTLAARPWGLAIYSADGLNGLEALRLVCNSLVAGIYSTAAGQVALEALRDPEVGAVDVAIPAWALSSRLDIERDRAPGVGPHVDAQRNWRPYSVGELLGGVDAMDEGVLTSGYRIRKSALTSGYRIRKSALTPICTELGVRDSALGSLLTVDTDAEDLVALIAALYPATARPRFARFKCVMSAATAAEIRPLNTVITVDSPGVSAVRWVVQSIDGDATAGEVSIRCWAPLVGGG